MTFSGVNNQITELLGWEGKSKVATSQHSFLSWHSAKTYKQNHAYLCTSQKLIKTCSGNPKVLLTHRLPGISVRDTCVSEIEKVNIFNLIFRSHSMWWWKCPPALPCWWQRLQRFIVSVPLLLLRMVSKVGNTCRVECGRQSVKNRKGFALIFISYWWFDFGLSVIWLRAWELCFDIVVVVDVADIT